MNKGKFLLFALVAMFATSCVADKVDQPVSSESDLLYAKKFVNNSVAAVENELIIYVAPECVESLNSAEVTRTGMSELDAWAEELNASSVRPVFNMAVNGDRKRELGMDRWFVIEFAEDVDVNDAAQKIAAIDYIERVQFSKSIERPEPKVVALASSGAATRASEELPFNDPNLQLQWHYNNTGNTALFSTIVEGEDINLFAAWELTAGRRDVIVAVVDEGVDNTHEDLKDNVWTNEAELNGTEGVDDDGNGYIDEIHGYNFARGGKVAWDRQKDSGHGTHVAGTVAAVNNNGVGVSGVAGGTGNGDGVRLMSVQIFSGDKNASMADTAAGVMYAADNGACILQCSWGLESGALPNDNTYVTGSYSVEYAAFNYFMETKNCEALDGGLVVFAAGNEGKPVAGYPGAYNEYICVTSYSADGLPAYYTCYDRGCNVSAPGGQYDLDGSEAGCVLSTVPKGLYRGESYAYMQGTSMACPHVSGMAALGLSYALDLGVKFSLKEYKQMVLTSVNAFDESRFVGFKQSPEGGSMNLASYKGKMGTGKLDAYRLLMAVRGMVCVPVSITESNTIDFNKFMGDGNLSMKLDNKYEIPQETIDALGITYHQVFGGKLVLDCTKPGAGTVKLTFIAGGTVAGGGQITGGMKIEKEFALIARPGVTVDANGQPQVPGGWL